MFSDENQNSADEEVVLKLNKSLYGLVQAPRSWYHHLQRGLAKLDFVPLAEDPGCVLRSRNDPNAGRD